MDISKKLVDTTFQMQKTTVIALPINMEKRIELLTQLLNSIEKNESEICAALFKDLHKNETEAYLTEINPVKKEIKEAIKNISKWIKSKKVKNIANTAFMDAQIYYQPYGVCLIISPWNYPVNISLLPLVGAIAAGNTAIIKLSEFAPNSAECIKNIVNNSLHMSYCKAFTGSSELSSYMSSLPFDLFFFTGSSSIGKKVMQNAAKNLTPVILELGGKSPCIVDIDAELKQAAKSIAWGKTINAGQTCIAPDYVVA